MKPAYLLILLAALSSCRPKPLPQAMPSEALPQVAFEADSALAYVARQTAFGPRVPGSEANKRCGDWLISELKRHGATVAVQDTTGSDYLGRPLPVRNILGSFRPDRVNRLLLVAHWDSRPWADHDKDKAFQNKPIDGANDGASGVAVLLEVARQLHRQEPPIGVDILLVDAEDGGTPDHLDAPYRADSWCQGAQLWGASPAGQDAQHRFGILLDMVGDPNARFPVELYSKSKAPEVVAEVWNVARQLGEGARFVNEDGGYITDDHLYLGRLTAVPVIDIIDYRSGGFCPTWHTHNDDLQHVSPRALEAVGRVVLTVVMKQK